MAGGADSEEIIGVAELDRRLRRAVEGATGREWVEGEVGAVNRAPSGHVYFSLKDEREEALIDCVMYRLNAQRMRAALTAGARLQVWGKATLWAPRGRLQLVVERARPAGRGALLLALEELKLKLRAEGLFEPERKRPLPPQPRVIGVVTSGSGAAFQDIRVVAQKRGRVRLVLSPALVQGVDAPRSIVRAIDLLERFPGLDVMIVGRGGGANEDLMAFNDERVVRRIAAVRVPVVSAVGHEVDVTLSDLVADVRAATPSQAAELVVPDQRAQREAVFRLRSALGRALHARLLEDRALLGQWEQRLGDPRFWVAERQQLLDDLGSRLTRTAEREIGRRRKRLFELQRSLAARHPRAVLLRARAETVALAGSLRAALRTRLSADAARLDSASVRLQALSPLAVLSRGYAIVTTADGRALRNAREVSVDEQVAVRLGSGRLGARVTRVEDEGP